MLFAVDTYKSHEFIEKEKEIFDHPAWHDLLIGIDCEDILRGKERFSYLLRSGEARFHYYLSYVVEPPFTYRHQPFSIATKDSKQGWGYRNGHCWWTAKLEDLIPLILHQPVSLCTPITRTQ